MLQEPVSKCSYLGKTYPLYAAVDPQVKRITVEFDGKSFILRSPEAGEIDISNALKSFYVKAAKKFIEQRLKYYQPEIKVKYKSVTIESDDKRWGSCSSSKNLTFNWKLMLFPQSAIDYVVVHELCHLKHMNHDRSFWRLIGKVYPQWKEAMKIIGSEKTRDM